MQQSNQPIKFKSEQSRQRDKTRSASAKRKTIVYKQQRAIKRN